ncbi:MAG: UxaA family hydrolase [Anaerolineae bacterium]
MANTLVIDSRDSVGVALVDLPAGTRVEATLNHTEDLVTREPIPFGHKVALVRIPHGDEILKYGASIGIAHGDIEPGTHVHVHNLKSVRGAAQ